MLWLRLRLATVVVAMTGVGMVLGGCDDMGWLRRRMLEA